MQFVKVKHIKMRRYFDIQTNLTSRKISSRIRYLFNITHRSGYTILFYFPNLNHGAICFIFRYIYGAFGGSRHGIVRQMFAYLCSFLFIFCWHGGEWYVFCWCTYNYLGISAEMLGKTFLPKTSIYNKVNVLTS